MHFGKITMAVAMVIAFASASDASKDAAERIRVLSKQIVIVDGDTIKFDKTTYRLMGFDAPETYQAKCEKEWHRGKMSSIRLDELINEQEYIELDVMGLDKYRRRLAVLYINGIDVAIVMIREGHAVAYNGRTKRRDWCNDD